MSSLAPLASSKPAAVEQVEFYFNPWSYLNDNFLLNSADSQGWISLSTVCGFPRMRLLNATDPSQIANLLRFHSRVVEVDDLGQNVRPLWRLDPHQVFVPSVTDIKLVCPVPPDPTGPPPCMIIWLPRSSLSPNPALLYPCPIPGTCSVSLNIVHGPPRVHVVPGSPFTADQSTYPSPHSPCAPPDATEALPPYRDVGSCTPGNPSFPYEPYYGMSGNGIGGKWASSRQQLAVILPKSVADGAQLSRDSLGTDSRRPPSSSVGSRNVHKQEKNSAIRAKEENQEPETGRIKLPWARKITTVTSASNGKICKGTATKLRNAESKPSGLHQVRDCCSNLKTLKKDSNKQTPLKRDEVPGTTTGGVSMNSRQIWSTQTILGQSSPQKTMLSSVIDLGFEHFPPLPSSLGKHSEPQALPDVPSSTVESSSNNGKTITEEAEVTVHNEKDIPPTKLDSEEVHDMETTVLNNSAREEVLKPCNIV